MEKHVRFYLAIIMVAASFNVATAQEKKCTPKAIANCSAVCDVKKCVPVGCGPEGTKKEEARVISELRTKIITLKKEIAASPSHKLFDNSIVADVPVGKDDDESLVLLQREVEGLERIFSKKEINNANASAFPNRALWVASLYQRVESLEQLWAAN